MNVDLSSISSMSGIERKKTPNFFLMTMIVCGSHHVLEMEEELENDALSSLVHLLFLVGTFCVRRSFAAIAAAHILCTANQV